ncbi:DUF1476 domain-containing protein [Terrihabitans sp. B22-R8]|uniref:DUF1476 domain-containing protein n=1 Tax=Terrihabitans sp. B22-R8 TaxID=3425128 RepID=UPI00403CFB0D
MTTFDDRKDAFERKYALDEEQRFRALARRNRYLGTWAAEKMGKSAEEAEAYEREVVKADFEEAGDEDVFRKVRGDLDNAGIAISDEEIRSTMLSLLDRAMAEVKTQ